MRHRTVVSLLVSVLMVVALSAVSSTARSADPTAITVAGQVHDLDGVNVYRAADYLVLYTPEHGATTGTNQYGFEAAVVDGVVVAAEDGVGNITIPKTGYVLSGHGHGSSRAWLATYATVGAVVSLDGVPPPPTPQVEAVTVAGTTKSLNGTNVYRAADYLVLYTPAHGSSTLTNQYGFEATVVNGAVTKVADGVGNAAIPSNGFVLSGHGTSKTWLKQYATVGASVVLGSAPPPPPGAKELLPDLGIRTLRQFQIVNTGGKKLLKFPVVTANVGDGPIEVNSKRASTTATLWTGHQTVYYDDGSTKNLPSAGAQFYFAGDGHNHWHILDFDLYEIFDPSGKKLAEGEKHGYCFQDNTQYRDWPGSSKHPQSPATFVYDPNEACGLGQPDAVTVQHGLSPGWADTYPASLPDQAIDITGLPDGNYTVKITADWQGFWKETNESNNSATALVKITGNTVTLLSAKDGL